MSPALFFVAGKYGHAEHTLGYTQFEAHEGGFIALLQASLVEEACSIGLLRLVTVPDLDPVMSLSPLKRSSNID